MDFSDSSWKDCSDTGRSTGAYIIFYQGGTIDHGTHVPGPVAQSSAESEYNAACTAGMALANFRLLIHELLNKDPEIFPEEAPLIILDSKSALCMAKNGKDAKHTRHIARRMHFVRNGEKFKMHKSIGVRSGSLTFLVPMSSNCRPPSHQSIFCILHFSPFLTKCILLAMCLVCLVSLPILAMHISYLLSNIIKGASSGTMSGYFFLNS